MNPLFLLIPLFICGVATWLKIQVEITQQQFNCRYLIIHMELVNASVKSIQKGGKKICAVTELLLSLDYW